MVDLILGDWGRIIIAMQADAAILHMNLAQVGVFWGSSLAFVAVLVLVLARRQPEDFRPIRVVGLLALCLSTSLPFLLIAYWLRPWNFQSILLQSDIALAVFGPIVTAFIVGYLRKRKLAAK